MKITLKNKVLVDFKGITMKKDAENDATLFGVLVDVLGAELEDDKGQAYKEKCERLDLAKKFFDADKVDGEIEIESEQVSMLEKRAGKGYPGNICWAISQAMK